jgi:lactate permease
LRISFFGLVPLDCFLYLVGTMETWSQVYTPAGHWFLSALVAGLPVLVLFYLLAVRRASAPLSASGGALTAILVATVVCRMPVPLALTSFLYGAAFGLLPIGYVVFAAIFLYQISLDSGQFAVMKGSIGNLTADRRLQALLIAFSFGAIIEGAAGFGTPVAISAALMVGLGFKPFYAAALCLIANTAPVAWGAVGTPLVTLASVSGLPIADLSAMNARILPITSLIVPLWLIRTMVGWTETFEVLPAIAVCGLSFASTQFLWGNYVDPYLVDIVGGVVSLIVTALFLKVWKPKRIFTFEEERGVVAAEGVRYSTGEILNGWMPFLILGVFVLLWGWPSVKTFLTDFTLGPLKGTYLVNVPLLDKAVVRVPPVVTKPTAEAAVYTFNWLAATGTGVMIACAVAALLAGFSVRRFLESFRKTCQRMKIPIMAIVPMLGLGYVTRYAGIDAILGLAFTRTGFLYPFFASFLGWLGVALTGSDTSSNALFGSLQRITAEQLHLDPVLMCAANSAGGVMGKMIDAQSIVVATTATNQVGNEGVIFKFVVWHSLALATVVALIVLTIAYVFPGYVPHGVKYLESLF